LKRAKVLDGFVGCHWKNRVKFTCHRRQYAKKNIKINNQITKNNGQIIG
jgi:hypothetical protein